MTFPIVHAMLIQAGAADRHPYRRAPSLADRIRERLRRRRLVFT